MSFVLSAGFVFAQIDEKKPSTPFTTQLEGEVASQLPKDYITQERRSPIIIVNRIIQIALSFLGIGTIILLVYAGSKWMLSQGKEDEISKAKKLIRNAVIGLIIITMAYSISLFITMRLQRATGSYSPFFQIGTQGTELRSPL